MTPDVVIAQLRSAGLRAAVAESLTGGLVSARLTDVPGCSEVFNGGVTTYTAEMKTRVLGVTPALLERTGPVDAEVARQMALGVADLFSADVTVSTTGVAGPEPHGGSPPGRVFIGWFAQGETGAVELAFIGDRETVREAACHCAFICLEQCVRFGRVEDASMADYRTPGPRE